MSDLTPEYLAAVSDEAVAAAAEAIEQAAGVFVTDGSRYSRAAARAALAAAIPHLKEMPAIEYGLRYTGDDGIVRVGWLPTREYAETTADDHDTLVQRAVYRSEWKEVKNGLRHRGH